ncbi:MAG: hypothetical protein AAGK32_00190 [Actinomycetota bacterium]
MGCCLIVLASWISPRLVLFLMWLFGDRLTVAFDSFWMGLAGFLVLPWTTLFFALAYAPVAGVTGIGWFFVVIGVLIDIASWGGGGRQGRTYYVAEYR